MLHSISEGRGNTQMQKNLLGFLVITQEQVCTSTKKSWVVPLIYLVTQGKAAHGGPHQGGVHTTNPGAVHHLPQDHSVQHPYSICIFPFVQFPIFFPPHSFKPSFSKSQIGDTDKRGTQFIMNLIRG